VVKVNIAEDGNCEVLQMGDAEMEQVVGGCLCGAVRFSAAGDPLRVGICHCLDCKKHHGSAFYAAAIFSKNTVQVVGSFAEYKGRCFCPKCGSSVFATTGDEIELHLGALDDPATFAPTYELWTSRKERWLPGFSSMEHHAQDRQQDGDL